MPETAGGSAARWGPLFSARAATWAETWEGAEGWGTPVYEYVLDRVEVGSDSRLLDCGCGAGRFARMAADRGASVAGIDASKGLIEIAALATSRRCRGKTVRSMSQRGSAPSSSPMTRCERSAKLRACHGASLRS